MVNNAYEIQSISTNKLIQKSMKLNLVDFVVSSTDKNYMTPVGGSIVYS